jgi:hypothetical protein
MVPTLKIPKGALLDNGFINGYVEMLVKIFTKTLYILKPDNLEKFKEFLEGE